MKALWKGYIVLGQLGIPVRLYAATQKSGVTFVQLHDKDSSPVERPLFCKQEHTEISPSEVIRGMEYEPGKFVTFTEQELSHSRSSELKAVNIKQFCSPAQVQPSYYEKPYYIVPTAGGERGYALLRDGLAQTGMVAVGQYYFYGSEHIGTIEADGDVLVLHQLRFSDKLIPRSDIKTPQLPRPNPSEIDMMKAVIERYSGTLHLRDYHNEYTEYIQLLAERKAKGLPAPKPEETPAHTTPEDDIQTTLADTLKHNTTLGEGGQHA